LKFDFNLNLITLNIIAEIVLIKPYVALWLILIMDSEFVITMIEYILFFVRKIKTLEKINCDPALVGEGIRQIRPELSKPCLTEPTNAIQEPIDIGLGIMKRVRTDFGLRTIRKGSLLFLTDIYETVIVPREYPRNGEDKETINGAQVIFSATRRHDLRGLGRLTGKPSNKNTGEGELTSAYLHIRLGLLSNENELFLPNPHDAIVMHEENFTARPSTKVPLAGVVTIQGGDHDQAISSFRAAAVEIRDALDARGIHGSQQIPELVGS